jgi:hypothetical protein
MYIARHKVIVRCIIYIPSSVRVILKVPKTTFVVLGTRFTVVSTTVILSVLTIYTLLLP